MPNPSYAARSTNCSAWASAWGSQPWPDYLALGLGPEHIPELIRMATDDDLNEADTESTRGVGAGACLAGAGAAACAEAAAAAGAAFPAHRRE